MLLAPGGLREVSKFSLGKQRWRLTYAKEKGKNDIA
jgi:hypothetical protein